MEKPADMKFSIDNITENYMGFPIVKKDITISFNGFSMEFFLFLPQKLYKKKPVPGVLHILNESSMLKHNPVGNPDNDFLPCDQHMLLAAIAPRPVYVKSNAEDMGADPDAELKSCKLATPVYELYNRKGLVMDTDEPEINKSYRSGKIGYHRAPGGHDMNSSDWDHFLDFIDDKFWVDFA